MKAESRCLSLRKGRERFVFRYAGGQESEVLASLVDLAGDPRSSFDWLDAALLSYEMGRQIAVDESLTAVR
jgi:hypothetical protein